MPEGIGTIYDYDELVRVIEKTIHRRDLSTSIPGWIAATELAIFRDCNVRPGNQTMTGTFAGGESQLAMPYGTHRFEKINMRDGDVRWTPDVVSLDWIETYAGEADGYVRGVATWGDALLFAPAPKAGIAYTLFYYGLPAPISRQNKTNRILEMGWDAYLYGALVLASAYMGDDDRIPMWAALSSDMRGSLKRAVWRSRAAGGKLVTQPDFQMFDRHTEESSI